MEGECDDPVPEVEPPEEDPLGGTVFPPEDLTVPKSQGALTGNPVATPQAGQGITAGIQLVNLNDLLNKPTQNVPTTLSHNHESVSQTPTTLHITVPGGEVINIPLNEIQKAVGSASGREPISNIILQSSDDDYSKEPTMFTSQNVPYSIAEPTKCDPDELEIKYETEEVSIIDPFDPPMKNNETKEISPTNNMISACNPSLNSKKPETDIPVLRPISLPGGHLVPIPLHLVRGGLSNISISLPVRPIMAGTTSDTAGQNITVPISTSSGTISKPGSAASSPNISPQSPGANMVLVLTPDGHLITSPVALSLASSSPNAVNTVPSMSNNLKKPIANTRTTIVRNSSLIKVLQSQKSAKMPSIPKPTASNKTPTATPSIYMSHFPRMPAKNRITHVPPVHWKTYPNSKLTWPSPSSIKKKGFKHPLTGSWTNPNPLSPKTQFPLSGAWTNPNPPTISCETIHDPNPGSVSSQVERDPLEGPVQEIIQYTAQNFEEHDSSTTFSDTTEQSPRFSGLLVRKQSKSTQCSLFLPKTTSLRESVSKTEPEEFKRPLIKSLGRGVGISVQAKCILYNVFKYFEQRKAAYKLLYTVSEITKRATGVAHSSVIRIMREARKTCNTDDPQAMPEFKAPNVLRTRVRFVISNMHIDTTLRLYAHECLLEKKESPGLHYLQKRCISDGLKAGKISRNFIGLRMKKLGFTTVKTARRLITIEGAPIRAWRYNYLNLMEESKEGKKNTVFTFAVNLRQLRHTNSNWEVLEGCDGIAKESRVLTIFHAANKNGFIDGCFLINDSTDDTITNEDKYREWLELLVLKRLPERSVVVLAHEKFHEMEDSQWKPNAGSPKKEIVDWLRDHLVGDVDETLPKCVLLEKVSKFPVEQKYSIDSLVKTFGHTPVHLPPSQKDLNPIEYVWEDIRSKFVVRGKLSGTVKDILTSEFSLSEDRLKRAWKQVHQCEETYKKNDPLVEYAQEVAINKLGGVWTCPINGPVPDGAGEDVDVDVTGSSDSEESDSSSSGQSKPASDSHSGSDLTSDSESESNSSSSGDSEDDVPLSQRINGNKRRKIE